MARPLTFTKLVYREVLSWDELQQDLQRWRAHAPTREQAEIDIAMHLHRLFRRRFRKSTDDPAAWRFVKLAIGEVCWRKVAAALLKRFCPEPPWRFSVN